MTSLHLLSRRALLQVGGGSLAAVSLAGCSFLDTGAVQKDGGSGADQAKGKDAPAFAEQVKAGKLPPLEERIPKTPLVVEPLTEAGAYGGTWHSAMITQEDATWLNNAIGYEPLVRWVREGWTNSPGTDQIAPNICESFEELEGGRVFEFKLREGMKWSDGEPCTAEDFRFMFEDVNVFPEMHPDGLYALWTNPSDGKAGIFEIVDDTTIRYVFKDPKPGFLNEIASNTTMVMPKHYMGQFHPLHNKSVDDLVKKANLNDWMQLFESKSEDWMNTEMPTLNAWRLTKALGEGTAVTAERNPYYWKTDPDGSQLPYIDKINCEVLLDVEVELLKIANGELDMQMRNFGTVRNKPVVAKNEEKGDYRRFVVGPEGVNPLVIAFNQTMQGKDKIKSKLYAKKDFRVGMSYAINRQKIIDTVYAGQGTPWQCAPLEGHPAFDKELGTQFTEYSVDKANAALDKAGINKLNSKGIRLREDGSEVHVIVLVNSAMPDHVDGLELVKADWLKVGVKTTIQRVAETLYWERVEANLAECSSWTGGNFEVRATQGSNHYYVPSNPRGSSRWGSTWANWYGSDGKEGQEPPAVVKKQLQLFDKMRGTYDADEATEMAKEILTIAKDQFVYMGICTPPDSYGIVKNNLHNVPESFPGSGGYMAPGPSHPEQYYFADN